MWHHFGRNKGQILPEWKKQLKEILVYQPEFEHSTGCVVQDCLRARLFIRYASDGMKESRLMALRSRAGSECFIYYVPYRSTDHQQYKKSYDLTRGFFKQTESLQKKLA